MSQYLFEIRGIDFKLQYSGVDGDPVSLWYSLNDGQTYSSVRNFYTDTVHNGQETVVEYLRRLHGLINNWVGQIVEIHAPDAEEPEFANWREELRYRLPRFFDVVDDELVEKQ